MDEELLRLTNIEIGHLKTHRARFVADGPYSEIAERLGLDPGAQLRDPFIDWLLDGSAFLAARVQQTINAEFPRFTGAMLDIVFPHLGQPTPSMAVVQFGFSDPAAVPATLPPVPRGLALGLPVDADEDTGRRGRFEATFMTSRGLRLWPLSVSGAEFLSGADAVEATLGRAVTRTLAATGLDAVSGIRVDLSMDAGGSLGEIGLDEMDLHVAGDDVAALMTAAILFGNCRAGILRDGGREVAWLDHAPLGFDRVPPSGDPDAQGEEDEDILLPYDRRSFDGYRLLHEYFAMPERFRFVRLRGLKDALAKAGTRKATLVFVFDQPHQGLSGRVGAEYFRLNCVPAINLFEKQVNTTEIDMRQPEHHVVADRSVPTAFEVHSILSVTGLTDTQERMEFRPFFSTASLGRERDGVAGERYYVAARRTREAPSTLRGNKALTDTRYPGSEVFLSFVDEDASPFSPALKKIETVARCTNRHLPLRVPQGGVRLRIKDDIGADNARLVTAPSRPSDGVARGRRMWDVVSHLSLNHLSLMDTGEGASAADTLRQLLDLYARGSRATGLLRSLAKVDISEETGRVPGGPTLAGRRPPPVAFTRGVRIALTFARNDTPGETAMLAAVLERFFAGYAPATSFTRTVLLDPEGEERFRWPKRTGQSRTL